MGCEEGNKHYVESRKIYGWKNTNTDEYDRLEDMDGCL